MPIPRPTRRFLYFCNRCSLLSMHVHPHSCIYSHSHLPTACITVVLNLNACHFYKAMDTVGGERCQENQCFGAQRSYSSLSAGSKHVARAGSARMTSCLGGGAVDDRLKLWVDETMALRKPPVSSPRGTLPVRAVADEGEASAG